MKKLLLLFTLLLCGCSSSNDKGSVVKVYENVIYTLNDKTYKYEIMCEPTFDKEHYAYVSDITYEIYPDKVCYAKRLENLSNRFIVYTNDCLLIVYLYDL